MVIARPGASVAAEQLRLAKSCSACRWRLFRLPSRHRVIPRAFAVIDGIEGIFDVELLRGRIQSLLADKTLPDRDRSILSEFEAAWARRDKGERY